MVAMRVALGVLAALVAGSVTACAADSVPGTPVAPGGPAVPAPGGERRVFDDAVLEGERGVKRVLVHSYGIPVDQIEGVECPPNQEVKQGNKFQCTVKLGGDNPKDLVVDITVRNDGGEYEVGAPRDK
jgi:hypothetical protein